MKAIPHNIQIIYKTQNVLKSSLFPNKCESYFRLVKTRNKLFLWVFSPRVEQILHTAHDARKDMKYFNWLIQTCLFHVHCVSNGHF